MKYLVMLAGGIMIASLGLTAMMTAQRRTPRGNAHVRFVVFGYCAVWLMFLWGLLGEW